MQSCFSKCFKRSKNNSLSSPGSSITTQSDSPKNLSEQKLISVPLSCSSRSFLTLTLNNSPFLRSISKPLYTDLPKHFQMTIQNKSTEILHEGQTTTFLCVLSSGEADIIVNGQTTEECAPGVLMGELEIMFNTPVKFTVRARSKCVFWVLNKSYCKAVFQEARAAHRNEIETALAESRFFNFLPETVKNEIRNIGVRLEYNAEEEVTKGLEKHDFCYLIATGCVKVQCNQSQFSLLTEGQCFGEFSLISTQVLQRNLKVTAEKTSKIFVFEMGALRGILRSGYRENFLRDTLLKTLQEDKYSSEIRPDLFKKIFDSFKFVEVNAGKVVIPNASTLKTKIIVLCYGSIGSKSNFFAAPQLFGFYNKNYLSIGTGKYIALTDSILAELSVSEVQTILGMPIQRFVNEISIIIELLRHPFFNILSKPALTVLIKHAPKYTYSKGDKIYKAKEKANKFYYIYQGSVGIYEDEDFVFRYDDGSIVGETCMILSKRRESAEALTKVVCYEFLKLDFESYLSNSIIFEYINKTLYFHSKFEIEAVNFQETYITAKSREYCVGSVEENKKFLVEVIHKCKISDKALFWMIVDQKCAVSQIVHPHILRFIRVLSNEKKVYFFYEYTEFATLDWFIPKRLSSSDAKFIVLSLAGILEYLHSKDILHRNIHPTNIGIEANGFIKLIGFKYIKECKGRSYTMLDTTPIYKAKEVLEGAGYMKASEYWSLGVILFEMLTGKLPFGVSINDGIMVAAEKILNNSLELPDGIEESDEEVIKRLLDCNYRKRLQSDIFEHRWAKKISASEILLGKVRGRLRADFEQVGMFVGNDKMLVKKLTRRDTLNTRNSDVDDYDWDQYF